MESGDVNPSLKRSIIGNYNTPSSFTPNYGTNTVKSAADAAISDFKAKGEAINGAKAAAAAEAAAVHEA